MARVVRRGEDPGKTISRKTARGGLVVEKKENREYKAEAIGPITACPTIQKRFKGEASFDRTPSAAPTAGREGTT